jgi:dihydrofolate reductase
MRRVVAGINMTLDGFCDHTVINANPEMHNYFADLLKSADTILYGRVTFGLMEYWRTVLDNPTGDAAMDQFAIAMDKITKVVFSRTLQSIDWPSARLAEQDLEKEVLALKETAGRDILVGSPGLISQLTNLKLIDEFQLLIHPVVIGHGLPLFNNIANRISLKLVNTKIFEFGGVLHFYEPDNL